MITLSTAFSLAAHDEGKRLRVYDDATGDMMQPGDELKGNPTIGFGINIGMNAGMLDDECVFLTLYRLSLIRTELSRLPFWQNIGDARQAILCDLRYNLGKADFYEFHQMLNALNEGDFVEAAVQIMTSKAARELPQRYTALHDMMLSGELTSAALSNPPQLSADFVTFISTFKDQL